MRAPSMAAQRGMMRDMINVNHGKYQVEWLPGMTVDRLLDSLHFSFRMLAIKVDDRVVLREDYATTPVPDGADVQVIHLISGG